MMKKSSKKEQRYSSMADFEKKYFPTAYKRNLERLPEDAHAFGVSLAEESLKRMREDLSKVRF